MQTALIRQGRIVLAPETALAMPLAPSSSVRLRLDDGRLLVEPSDDGVRMQQLQIPVAAALLDALGWSNGDVVALDHGSGTLVAHRLTDPLDPALTTMQHNGVPIPPHWLIQTVANKPRVDEFVEGGHRVARLFADLIGRYLPGVQKPVVMDFGCGCGRVARALLQELDCQLHGCDLFEPAVEWCRRNLRGEYELSTEHPPLPDGDGRFDALYAVSVLTHLGESHQDAWLAEWRRLIRPGGLALVTYRGDAFLSKASEAQRTKIESLWEGSGFGFRQTDYWEGIFPEYYGGAYHRDEYVRRHWGRFFEVLELLPSTETGFVQDLAVMRRPGD